MIVVSLCCRNDEGDLLFVKFRSFQGTFLADRRRPSVFSPHCVSLALLLGNHLDADFGVVLMLVNLHVLVFMIEVAILCGYASLYEHNFDDDY